MDRKKPTRAVMKLNLFSVYNYNKMAAQIVNTRKDLKKADQELKGKLFESVASIIKLLCKGLDKTQATLPKQPRVLTLNAIPPPDMTKVLNPVIRLQMIAGAVCSASEIWLTHDGPAFDAYQGLRDSMESFYNGLDSIDIEVDENDIQEGGFYVGQYFSQCHRVKVLNIHGIEAEVFHVDYGSREIIPLDVLRPLMPQFSQLPAQAFRASLAEITPLNIKKWSIVANHFLELKVRGQKLWANAPSEIIESPNGQYVELFLHCEAGNETYVNGALLRLWHGVNGTPEYKCDYKYTVDDYFTGQAVAPLTDEPFPERDEWVKECILMEDSIPTKFMALYESINMADMWSIGDYREVMVYAARTPAYFIMLLAEQHEAFEKLKREMTEYYEYGFGKDLKMARTVMQKNQHCAVRSADGIWVRAIIIQGDGRAYVSVKMLDTEVFERVAAKHVKPLRRRWGALPAQAHVTRLSGVKTVNNLLDWPYSANQYFEELVQPHNVIKLFARAHRMCGRLSVELFNVTPNGTVNIAHELIRAGEAEPTPWLLSQGWPHNCDII